MNTNAPEASIRAVLDESSHYYVLTFTAANPAADGRLRAVRVTVRRPSAEVRARSGYYAAPAQAAAVKEETVEGVSSRLLPYGGLPLAVAAAPVRARTTGDGSVVVAVGAGSRRWDDSTLPLLPPSLPEPERVEVLTSAFPAAGGDAQWHRQTVDLQVVPGRAGELQYEALSRLDLKPGRYEVRVAVRHQPSGATGSVHTYVDVPDFDREALTLSGIVLHDPSASIVTPASALGDLAAHPPTTRRAFAGDDDVVAVVRVSQRERDQPETVSLAFRIVDAGSRTIFARESVVQPADFEGGPAVDASLELPLDGLTPGEYILSAEASRGSVRARRDLRFTRR